MNRPNTVLYAVIGVAGAVALAVIVTAAELHGRRRVLKEASAVAVTTALRDWADAIEPSTDALERIRARTQRRAA